MRAEQRLNQETDEREARLADLNVRASERRQESEHTRIAILAEMNDTARHQLHQESVDERDARLDDMRVRGSLLILITMQYLQNKYLP